MVNATHVSLTTVSLAVLAFLVAFYALIVRERKTPYLTNRIYSAVFCVLLGILLESGAGYASVTPQRWLHRAAVVTLLGGIAWTAWTILIIHNRQVNLRSDNILSNMRFARAVKAKFRLIKPAHYEHKPPLPSGDLLDSLARLRSPLGAALAPAFTRARGISDVNFSVLVTLHASSVTNSDGTLLSLAESFLDTGHPVQFVSCIRHPIEFVLRLKQRYDATPAKDWNTVATQLYVVDAFTPHYGFTDSVHDNLRDKLTNDLRVNYLRSAESYAGLHSATAKAFNLIKASLGKTRKYALVIYEGAHGLVDLESREQYRIFIRHVFPSETVWGGMLTVFAEFDIAADDLSLLRMYSHVFIDEVGGTGTEPLFPEGPS